MNRQIGNYNIICPIGNGGQSCVYMGMHRLVDFPVAIKIMLKDEMSESLIEKEIFLMKKISHPHIASLLDVVYDNAESTIALILEYAPNGPICCEGRVLNEQTAFRYFFQICTAVNYLHNELKIVHRDLKAENILLDEFNNVKLIDFGLSRSKDARDQMMKTRCGSPLYSSPEIVLGNPYNEKTDIWSLGILLYHMLTGMFPFKSDNIMKLFYYITKNEVFFPMNYETNLSSDVRDLILKMLEKDPNKRPSIIEVLNHSWFQRMRSELVEFFHVPISEVNIAESYFYNSGISPEIYQTMLNEDPEGLKSLKRILIAKKERELMNRRRISQSTNKLTFKASSGGKRFSGPSVTIRKGSHERHNIHHQHLQIFKCNSMFKPKILKFHV